MAMESLPPSPVCPAAPQLLEVHVYFRHGDRSPTPLGEAKAQTELWASRVQEVPVALQNREYFPQKYPWGLLTMKGAQQARELGAWLREHYIPKFSKTNGEVILRETPEKFLSLRTTNFLRTNLTAWFLLEGFLESPEIAATIPFACREEKDENLYHNEHCPRLQLKWKQAWAAVKRAVGQDGVNWRERFKDMQAAMARALEIELGNPKFSQSMDGEGFPWITAVDTFECARFHGDPLPEGIAEENVMAVRTLLAEDYAASFHDRDVLQLSIGTLVRELKEALVSRVNAPESPARPSLYLYSGHDATIMPLSVAFGVPWTVWPSYTSSICVELWRTQDGEHYVRILYDREEVAIPVSRAERAPKKVMLSLEEFSEVAEWSVLSSTDFSSRCQDISDIIPTPNRIIA
ncbi:hypothetical protein KC19_10G014400 [Ceratodon purpureus]|uniref:Acid phosphatase n=1 Tax=Ceratodon purpureus TaxID=3225 RepID=A0A8T0GGV4_CERPU|nr:hypothetical protein KC19_10G014400 [Ceratodon purpureus]